MKYFIKIIIVLLFSINICFADEVENLFVENVHVPMLFTYVPRGLIVSIDDKYFFNSGSVKINDYGTKNLSDIANVINKLQNDIVVESHYADENLKDTLYKELWELSLAKANNITKYLMRCEGVKAERIFSLGYGEIAPLVENEGFTNRVDFVVLDYKAKR